MPQEAADFIRIRVSMMSSSSDKKVNNKGFTLIELIVSIAICVLVASAIGVLLTGSLGNFDYNQTTIGLQIESQQYAQRIGNAIQTTGYAVYTCPVTDSTGHENADVDNLYLYTVDPNDSNIVNCEVYYAEDTGATYNDHGTPKHLYTINHYQMSCLKSELSSGSASPTWSGAGMNSSEPLAGSVASVHYKVYDGNGNYFSSGARPGSGVSTPSGVVKMTEPKKVTVEIQFLSKNRTLKLDDATFYFRNGTVDYVDKFPTG